MFRDELTDVINKHSMENGSNTPDRILADYLNDCLIIFDKAVRMRDNWYGVNLQPGVSTSPNSEKPR